MKLFTRNTSALILFAVFLCAYSIVRLDGNGGIQQVIRSDASGYYAYLPALFIFNDPSFSAVEHAEQTNSESRPGNLYLYLDQDGETYNKYFPGIAVLQAPFFAIGHLFTILSGTEANGYTYWYKLWFYIGSLCYVLLGLFYFIRLLKRLYPELVQKFIWLFPLLYVCTPLLHYSMENVGFSHLYSFFLFVLFGNLVMDVLHGTANPRTVVFLALVFGLIVLVRPTNAVIVFCIPVLAGSWVQTKEFFRKVVHPVGPFLLAFFFACAVLFIQPAIWKWETGSWLVWSYSGEGFNFLSPHLLEVLFSFRIGLFLHHPIFILVLLSAIFLFKVRPFFAAAWGVYFFVNFWVISSWWCWDYESPFGVRPIVEHLPFLLLPLFANAHHWKKSMGISLVLITALALIRHGQLVSGSMPLQRFTAASYFKSLAFWKASNFDRWNFTLSCPPHGERIKTDWLYMKTDAQLINDEKEFWCVGEMTLDSLRVHERYYFAVDLEKKVQKVPLDDVVLVVDASDKESEQRYYANLKLYNDRFEGKGEWMRMRFEGMLHDQLRQFDRVKIYIWNRNPNPFSLRNVEIKLETYKEE